MNEFLFDILRSLLITAATSAVTGIIVYAKQRRKADKQRDELLEKRLGKIEHTSCTLMRAQMVAIHEVYYPKGYCPMHVKEIMQQVHTIYDSYNENGLGTQMYNETVSLPEVKKE